MEIINRDHFVDAEIIKMSKLFHKAEPYKNLVIDNFLDQSFVTKLYEKFPAYDKLSKPYKGLNEYKAEGSNFDDFHPYFFLLKEAMNEERFYKWLSLITGVEKVFSTDDKLGAGIHQGINGSFLDIHIDFNIHPKLNLHRRLNLLIYLQKDWSQEYNGALELWNSDVTKCEKYIEPIFNRCVVFETNDISYHGYTQKINVPEGVTRKSFYAYYYTIERDQSSSYHDTIFRALPQSSRHKKISTYLKENFKNTIKSVLKKAGIVL